jgi:hypothetical protein
MKAPELIVRLNHGKKNLCIIERAGWFQVVRLLDANEGGIDQMIALVAKRSMFEPMGAPHRRLSTALRGMARLV